MTFPQAYDGDKKLSVNVLFLPRNQNPFSKAIEGNPPIPDAPAFVDAKIVLRAKMLYGTEHFPNNLNASADVVLPVKAPLHKTEIFKSLADAKHFNIQNLAQSNANLDGNTDKANKARTLEQSVKKYLPLSYRTSFNFISPLIPTNAVTDDSYHCAVRNAAYVPGFKQTTDVISWGKVFSYVLRNRVLTEQAGFIYRTQIDIDVANFAHGGWLYIDLADDSDYKPQQKADDTFIKKYAARIPALKSGNARTLFAANQFPVQYKKPTDLVDPEPVGHFDNIFIEAADYDDGFAKIVHSFQPVSQNLLQEESDGFHPTVESGIRLGWDDEQILAWYIRQMAEDTSVGTGQRIDAPNGVFGYHIDVKEQGAAAWQSLNAVETKDGINPLQGILDPAITEDKKFTGELPFQVYPSTLDGDMTKNFWLPMYFANWNGHSMVLPDEEAIKIYQHDEEVQPDYNPADPAKKGKTNVTGSPKNELLKVYNPVGLTTKLKYGSLYDFRIRLTDMTHGGPAANDKAVNDATTPVTTCHFKRYVSPATIRVVDGVPFNDDGAVFTLNAIEVQRPLLGYPAVVFCNKYTDPVNRLITKLKTQLAAAKADPLHKKIQMDEVGLADPDVDSVEITVEVQALKMDYQLSTSGKESYAVLYKTVRKFSTPVVDDDYESKLSIPLVYKDANVLKFGDTSDLGDLGANQPELDLMHELVLPTARAIRLTIRAVCEAKGGYYGLEKPVAEFNTRYGRTSYINLYQPSVNETDLFATKQIQGIYLQPDEAPLAKPIKPHVQFVNTQAIKTPDSVERLAQQLKIESNGLNLVGKKGQRIQFGCSARIRHTLAPDNSALTFASKAELYHHWLCCITLDIKRDWTWDALEDMSFIITRKMNFKQTPGEVKEEVVGEVDIKHSISFTALQNPDRTNTTLVFIDAVEPKKEQPDSKEAFPDLIEVTYTVTPRFKSGHGATKDGDLVFDNLQLPVTINPTQIPKIASAGIALSPYHRNEKYSSTQPRRRFLWIEFEEPVRDPNDLYFARVMAYAPDQLISNNNHALEKVIAEPPLNIDPEYIRVISPGASNDEAGINAMQPMEKSLLSDRHYLLPLPPGLNESSAELFGFFTYEFRVGHAAIWSTAQGRYGRALKATGIQHPAPTLTCAVNRDEQKLYVTSPYATAVFNGKNVTASPPRTELWCLLYAQVKQADNNDAAKELKDYRNILLDDRFMHWSIKLEHKPTTEFNRDTFFRQQMFSVKEVDVNVAGIPKQNVGLMAEGASHDEALTSAMFNQSVVSASSLENLIMDKMKISETNLKYIKPVTYADLAEKSADATKYGTTFWTNKEINDLLRTYGLPLDLSLSVLCVEVFTNITNEREYRTRSIRTDASVYKRSATETPLTATTATAVVNRNKPLSDGLGDYRILRTSPLSEVPYICCTD